MENFRKDTYDLMFTTNMLARGIDIRSVGLVVNIGTPRSYGNGMVDHATYLHRVARTGRYNDLGTAVTICKPNDGKYVQGDDAIIDIVL